MDEGAGILRKGVVAEEDLDNKDDGKREHLFRNLQVEFKKAAACNAPGAVGEPARKGGYSRLPAPSICSSLGRGWLRWWDGSSEANELQRVGGETEQARDEYE